MKKISTDLKLTIQVIISIVLIVAGLTLLFLGFYSHPIGQIDNSVLVAYGESSTFAGALLGIDYSYKFKRYEFDERMRRREGRQVEEDFDEKEPEE